MTHVSFPANGGKLCFVKKGGGCTSLTLQLCDPTSTGHFSQNLRTEGLISRETLERDPLSVSAVIAVNLYLQAGRGGGHELH